MDVVFDTMGGDVQKNSFKVLKKHTGRIISIVSNFDAELVTEYDVTAKNIWLEPNGQQLQEITDLLEQKKVRLPLPFHKNIYNGAQHERNYTPR